MPGRTKPFRISVPSAVALTKQIWEFSSKLCPWSPHSLKEFREKTAGRWKLRIYLICRSYLRLLSVSGEGTDEDIVWHSFRWISEENQLGRASRRTLFSRFLPTLLCKNFSIKRNLEWELLVSQLELGFAAMQWNGRSIKAPGEPPRSQSSSRKKLVRQSTEINTSRQENLTSRLTCRRQR